MNVIWFNDRSSDGVLFSSLFDPMPYEVIALVLTVVRCFECSATVNVDGSFTTLKIECCIDEWSKGSWNQVPFTYESYKEVYCHHLGVMKGLALQGLDSRKCDPMRELRQDLFDKGR
jgi:hypothetical protein